MKWLRQAWESVRFAASILRAVYDEKRHPSSDLDDLNALIDAWEAE